MFHYKHVHSTDKFNTFEAYIVDLGDNGVRTSLIYLNTF